MQKHITNIANIYDDDRTIDRKNNRSKQKNWEIRPKTNLIG